MNHRTELSIGIIGIVIFFGGWLVMLALWQWDNMLPIIVSSPWLDALYDISRELVQLFTGHNMGVFLQDEGLIAIRESVSELGLYSYGTGEHIEAIILHIAALMH